MAADAQVKTLFRTESVNSTLLHAVVFHEGEGYTGGGGGGIGSRDAVVSFGGRSGGRVVCAPHKRYEAEGVRSPAFLRVAEEAIDHLPFVVHHYRFRGLATVSPSVRPSVACLLACLLACFPSVVVVVYLIPAFG